jgi:hypothetical protein
MNAVVLQFPENVQRRAKRRLDRVDLDARLTWMWENADKWGTEQTDGMVHHNYYVQKLTEMLRKQDGVKPPTLSYMRKEIAKHRRIIERRNCVKAWLKTLGADLGEITTAEQALFAAFDLIKCELPGSF